MNPADPKESKRVPIREGLFSSPLEPAERVKLMGSQCGTCAEVTLGEQSNCTNCGGNQMKKIPLSRRGKLWTYTVIRHRPPGDYKGPDPFVPFGLGLVELPEGIRVLSPLDCALDKLKIGMDLELEVFPYFRDQEGKEVMAFKFKPVQEG